MNNSASPYANITDEAERKKKALAEKEKGNEHYQKRQFMQAAHHYTTAIELDATDMVFYLNRAGKDYFLFMVI